MKINNKFFKIILILICISLTINACTTEKKKEVTKVLSTKEIAKTVGKDVVFLETKFGSGSGILLEDGYILTNQHVLEGFSKVDVTLESGKTHDDVKVFAQDVSLDLALVGPIKEKGSTKNGTTKNLDKGDEVYLIGYPDETDSKPETTITKGILSRVRKSDDKKTVFLQTDASISEGQSGGAMVNTKGEIIGLSGLGDDTFGFSVSVENIAESIKSMKKEKIKPYNPFPTTTDDKRGLTEQIITLKNRYDTATFKAYVEKETKITLEFPVDAIPAIDVYDALGNLEEHINKEYINTQTEFYSELTEESFFSDNQNLEQLQPNLNPIAGGKYEIEIPEDTYLIIDISSADVANDAFVINMKSSIGLVYHEIRNAVSEITIGETKSGEIDAFELQNQYLVDLEKGKKYEVSMRSKVGDSYFLIFPTTKLPTKIFESDDAEDDAGIFGFDAIDEFKPQESGKYTILIPSDGYTSIEYKLFVKEVK